MCWYTPHKESQKHFKRLCQELVDYIRFLEKNGDPDCCNLNEAHQLINHLYNPYNCKKNDGEF